MAELFEIDQTTDKQPDRFPITGYLFLVSTAFFTAISYILGKSVDNNLNPETVTFFWFFGAFLFAIIVSLFIPSQRTELKNFGRYKSIFIYSSILTSVGAAFWIISLRTIGPPLTSFLMKSQTLFSLLLGIIFLGERLNKGESIGILVTITGGIVVAYQREGYLIFGTLMAIGAALCYSTLSFLVKKIAQDLNMITVATLRSLGVSIIVLIYLIITGRFGFPDTTNLVFMFLGGITGAYIAKGSQFQSIKLLDVSRSTAVMPMESLFVVVFSFLIFDDLPSVAKLLGGAAIIAGVVFLVIFRGEKNEMSKL